MSVKFRLVSEIIKIYQCRLLRVCGDRFLYRFGRLKSLLSLKLQMLLIKLKLSSLNCNRSINEIENTPHLSNIIMLNSKFLIYDKYSLACLVWSINMYNVTVPKITSHIISKFPHQRYYTMWPYFCKHNLYLVTNDSEPDLAINTVIKNYIYNFGQCFYYFPLWLGVLDLSVRIYKKSECRDQYVQF